MKAKQHSDTSVFDDAQGAYEGQDEEDNEEKNEEEDGQRDGKERFTSIVTTGRHRQQIPVGNRA